MRIIEPSAQIIEDELSQLSIYQRIAYCAGVCYQREPNKTEEEAQAFCKKMVSIGHLSTLEMAVVHLKADRSVDEVISKYIREWYLSDEEMLYTGSIRAFLECSDPYVKTFLREQYPVFSFNCSGFDTADITFAQPHEIPWQHQHVAVRFIVNRAVSHELVRHRPMSFLQESQRYCRYEDEVVFIRPEWFDKSKRSSTASAEYDWESHMNVCECRYQEFLYRGLKPQQARAVLPNSTKTELIAYASLPQWKHIFNLRCSPAADPEMTRLMRPLKDDFMKKYPEMYSNE